MAVDQNQKNQSPQLFLYFRFRLETRPRVDLPFRILQIHVQNQQNARLRFEINEVVMDMDAQEPLQ
jgi:hypothetical protein